MLKIFTAHVPGFKDEPTELFLHLSQRHGILRKSFRKTNYKDESLINNVVMEKATFRFDL